jgi:predicted helicase
MPGRALAEAYQNRLFANEVMLLPYYVASLNIEHAYYERIRQYEPFPGLCFVDTLDMAEAQQANLFTAANTERVQREKEAAITVIIGNPPYNVGQKSENDNNKNRKYKVVDGRIHETYAKDSKASSKSKLNDAYVKFFRWAADRLNGRDGIVCFVSNNGFIDQTAFDGMRKHLLRDFDRIDHIDLHGNVRRNPKLSGTTHNVFGIQVGVGITLAIRKRGAASRLRYHRVPETWRKGQKLEFLTKREVPWHVLAPGPQHIWLEPSHADEYRTLLPMGDMFDIRTLGLNTNRDEVVYDFDVVKLDNRIREFIAQYNGEVDRHKRDKKAAFSDSLKWSSRLKECLSRGQQAMFEESKIRIATYRPYCKRWVFFDGVLNQRTFQWPRIKGSVICLTDVASEKPFMALMCDTIVDLHLVGAGAGTKCFPLSHLNSPVLAQFRQYYSNDSITKDDLFHYIYAVLHHPEYRARYAANLKRELPRIPFAPGFTTFVTAGRELARLHVEYESLEPWPLQFVEDKHVPYSERVTKMKLSPDRQSLWINESLTLVGIPAEVFEYRLGARSALEWVIDQYQIKGESDPNREDDPGYIVRLVGQVVRVSVATVEMVKSLPSCR